MAAAPDNPALGARWHRIDLDHQSESYAIRHFEYLNHFEIVMRHTMDQDGRLRWRTYMDLAVKFPFLLDQMLAL